MKHHLTGLLLTAAVLFAAAPASAEYTARGLTTNAGKLDIYAGAVPRPLLEDHGLVFETGGDDLYLSGGVAYGVTDSIDVGVSALHLRLFDDTDIFNPYVYGTFKILDGDVSLGLRPVIPIPVFDGGFWVGLDVPLMVRLGGSVRLDTGASLHVGFTDPVWMNLFIPARLAFEVTDSLFLGVDTGLDVPLAPNAGDVGIPLGAFIGYTVAPGIDIVGSIRWSGFFNTGRDPVLSGRFPSIGIGVNVYDLL